MTFKITLSIFLFGLCGHVYACKCIGPGTVKESFKKADGIIFGQVVSIQLVSFAETIRADKRDQIRERIKKENGKTENFDYKGIVKIELKIIDNIKGGIASDTVTIYTTDGGPSCGYDFEIGKEYIVYGSVKGHADSFYLTEQERLERIENKNSFWTNRCTRTTVYSKLEADELRELKKKSG